MATEVAQESRAKTFQADAGKARAGWASREAFWWALALPSLGLLLFALFGYSVDVLVKDEWDLVIPVAKFCEGTFTWADLWFRQNEHRMVLPLAFWVPFIRLTRWAKPWPVVPDVVLVVTWFLLVAFHLRSTARRLAQKPVAWYLPLLAILLFSLLPREIWVENVGMSVRLAALAATAVFFWLTAEPLGWPKVWAAIAASAAASFSFGNGLVIWPVGCLPLAVADLKFPRKAAYLAVWLAAAGLVYLAYAADFRFNPEHPLWKFGLEHPLAFVEYFFAYLGGPGSRLAGAWTGFAAVAVFLGAALWLRASGAVRLRVMLPYLLLGLFGIANALWTAMGRAGFGVAQAVSPRYAVHASFLWLADIALLYLLFQTGLPAGGLARLLEKDRFYARAWVSLLIALVMAFSLAFTSLGAYRDYWRFLPWVERARAEILSERGTYDEEVLRALHPWPWYVAERIPYLKKHGLSVFREKRHD